MYGRQHLHRQPGRSSTRRRWTRASSEGITRDAVIELARSAGLTVVERTMDRYDIYTADECFLTGTAAELIPVVECDGRMLGSGRPGPITRDLRQRFGSLVREER